MVPMVSLIQRFHCTGQLTVVPMVSLIQRFHCTGQLTVVPMVSLIQRFHCTGQLTVVPMVAILVIEVSLYCICIRPCGCVWVCAPVIHTYN